MNFYNSLLSGAESTAEIVDELCRVGKQLDHLLTGNLGSKNIREVGDYLVGANDFVSRSGTVGISSLVTGGDDLRFWAGSSTRESAPFRVYESGDTHVANLLCSGGTITGATIQTASSGARIVMNSSDFASYDTTGKKRISLSPSTATYGLAGLEFIDDGSPQVVKGHIFSDSLSFGIVGQENMTIRSLTGILTMLGTIDFTSAILTMPQKADAGVNTDSTSVADSHNHGFTTSDYLQCYDSVGNPTSKKQWVPYAGSAAHSHSQN